MIDIRTFGAIGDGATDDTQAFRAAVNHCITYSEHLYMPRGTYLLDGPNDFTGIPDGTKLTISGDGDATVLKMKDGGVTQLWHRLTMWRPATGASVWLTFRDFNVDNNARGNPLDPEGDDHQFEQAHTFRFTGGDGIYEKVSFENVHVFDPVADVFSNASPTCREFRVVNCGVTGRTRQRSDIQFSYAPSAATISDFIGDVIETEVVGTNQLDAHCSHNLTNATVNYCDLGLGHGASEKMSVNINNLVCKVGFYITGEQTSARISNSDIRCQQLGGRNTHELGLELVESQRQSSFTNCRLTLPAGEGSFTGFCADRSHIRFEGCDFVIEGDQTGPLAGRCLYSNYAISDASPEAEIPVVTVANCTFDPRADQSLDCYRAGIWYVSHCILAGRLRALRVGASSGRVSEVTVDSCDFRKVTGWGFYINRSAQPRSLLTLTGDHLGENAALFEIDAGSRDDINVSSTRRVVLSPTETTVPVPHYSYGLLGDTLVRSRAPLGAPVSWYRFAYSADGWGCKEQAGIENYTTLPTAKEVDKGWRCLYGGTPMVWDGAVWRFPDGTAAP